MQPIQKLLLNPLTGINLVSISLLNDNFYMTAKCDTVSSYLDKTDDLSLQTLIIISLIFK